MRPCVGVDGICPPLCKWSELNDGTYSLYDVELFNQTMSEMVADHKARIAKIQNDTKA